MKHSTRILLIVVFIAAAMAISACKRPEGENNGQKIQPVNVRIEIVKPSRLTDAIQVAGTVKAYEDANISPEEGGVVKEWKVKKGACTSRKVT